MAAEQEEDLLAERLNHQPVVLFGYTDSEFVLAIKVISALCFPLTFGIGLTFGKPMPGLAAGFLLSTALVVGGGKVLQFLKRGKPDFYYQTRFKRLLEDVGLGRSGLIRHAGAMSLGRTHYRRY